MAALPLARPATRPARAASHVCCAKGPKRGGAKEAKRTRQQAAQQAEEAGEALEAAASSTSGGAAEERDFWEGEQWDWIATALRWSIPALAVGGVLVGSLAGSSYNQGADSFLVLPGSEDGKAVVLKGSDIGIVTD